VHRQHALLAHQAAEVETGLATLKALIDKNARAVTPYVVFLKVTCRLLRLCASARMTLIHLASPVLPLP